MRIHVLALPGEVCIHIIVSGGESYLRLGAHFVTKGQENWVHKSWTSINCGLLAKCVLSLLLLGRKSTAFRAGLFVLMSLLLLGE